MKLELLAAAFLPLLAGCMADPPVRHDSSLAAGGAAVAYPTLTVAWVRGENMKEVRGYIDKFNVFCVGFGRSTPDDMIETVVGTALRQTFKSAVRVDSVEEAVALKTDLVAVVDAFVELPKNIFSAASVTVKASFLSPSQRPVEEVNAGSRKVVNEVTSFGLGVPRLKNAVWLAVDESMVKLSAALGQSSKLADFARKGSPAEAVAAAPVRSYRSDVDTPSYGAGEDEHAFALVVGVEKYQGLPEAQFAARDAEAVRNHLRAMGYPERNILYLSDQRALKSAIEKYVEAWLPQHTDEKSHVFVYFSGHGAPDVASKQAYIVPWDGDPKFLANTAYPVKRLYEKLNALKARRVVVALDSCFSGAGGRSVIPQGLRPLVTQVDPGTFSVGKLAVLAASGPDEVTGTSDAQGHGLFTYYLLKGLNQSGGKGTVKTLYDYLRPKVADAARGDGRDQMPQLLGSNAGAALN
jgi:hypothetical protein